MTQKNTLSHLVAWDTAAQVAAQLVPAGPQKTVQEMTRAVESIRYAALMSVEHVHRITQLEVAHQLTDSQVLVVDRPTWSKANTQAFSTMLNTEPSSRLAQKMKKLTKTQKTLVSYATATEVGAVLAYLSTRVLGQYEPYAARAGYGASGGRLMLVAPNILALEEELHLDPEDFRLWVCLHEQTHRVQFAAAPWLDEYILQLVHRLSSDLGSNTEELFGRVIHTAKTSLGHSTSSQSEANSLALNDSAHKTLSEVTAVMSLLEGHANVVMDSIDASVVPSIKTIRQRFNRRSQTHTFFHKIVQKLFGMERKLQQYKDGQKFVQYIVDAQGMDRFNMMWERPENLPTEQEIHHPQQWIDRMLASTERVIPWAGE
ncbi:zinc-dependent metalloprotease [Rothia sp. P13129]|uniref:zinc-dependent metalloprotease n=1 Tax=Rothia sp. P13129 TaxID=3402664 RepID=UPI003AD1EAA1